jgi:hypothetical protein
MTPSTVAPLFRNSICRILQVREQLRRERRQAVSLALGCVDLRGVIPVPDSASDVRVDMNVGAMVYGVLTLDIPPQDPLGCGIPAVDANLYRNAGGWQVEMPPGMLATLVVYGVVPGRHESGAGAQ